MFSIQLLKSFRAAEIEKIAAFLRPGCRILEIGAGTGQQALALRERGFDVTAIEMPSSAYASERVFPVIDYDGHHIPLPDRDIDIVFSSNVLEHVADLGQMHNEIRRVLKPGGYCVHVLPTHSWRAWTTLTSYPDAVAYVVSNALHLLPHGLPRKAELRRLGRAWYGTARYAGGRLLLRRHGERGNFISEMWLFHPSWWRRNFAAHGFRLLHDEPMRLFYTGNLLLGDTLSFDRRERLAGVLGSACHLFKIQPA